MIGTIENSDIKEWRLFNQEEIYFTNAEYELFLSPDFLLEPAGAVIQSNVD